MVSSEIAVSPSPISSTPAPWTLKGTVYTFLFYVTPSQAKNLPSIAYSPLEGGSSFGAAKAVGGLGNIQIIRYFESPVGPYDEMVLIPGKFEYEVEQGGPKRRNFRVTRIYVSQKETCYNGRKNWSIPKHLARFEFKTFPTGSTEINVYPHDTSGDITEARAAKTPFFSAVFKPSQYIPNFPLSWGFAAYVGIDVTLVQPPLPKGNGSQGELPGTEKWCKILPVQYSYKASIGWWDLKKSTAPRDSGEELTEEDGLLANRDGTMNDAASHLTFADWSPDIARWSLGVKMEDATIVFDVGTHWED